MPAPSTDPRSALIAKYLDRRRKTPAFTEDAITKRANGAAVEASEEQRRIWLHCVMGDCAELYNEPFILQYAGELNIPAFERAFNEILRRHEAWRTSFEACGDRVFQNVVPELHVDLPSVDLRNLPGSDREKRVAELLAQDSKLRFDLEEAPLFRGRIVRVADRDFRFLLVAHHLIADGVSIYQIFVSELESCYADLVQGREPSLPPLPFQYPDYAEWQRRSAARRQPETHLEFWEQQLRGLPVMNLPLDRPRSAFRKIDGGAQSFCISKELTQALKNAGESCQATLFMAALAALHLLLYIYTGDRDQVIGSATSTRKQFGTEHLLGLFINAIVLRTGFSPEDSFLALIRRVRETTLGVLTNDIPFDVLARRFGGNDVPSITPLFQVMFVVEPSPTVKSPEWRIGKAELDLAFAKSDLYLQVQENCDELVGRFTYARDIFDAHTVIRLKQLWLDVLSAVAVNPNLTLEEISTSLRKPEPQRSSFLKWFRQRMRNSAS
jgi:Condensation domain